jgi:hypothetical protein
VRNRIFFSSPFNELSRAQNGFPFSSLSSAGIALQYTDEVHWRCNMKILKTLTFAVMSRGSQNPVLARRAKLIHRLEQQKRLAQDANFVVTVSRWLRNEAGSKELVRLQKRVRPWWRDDALGTIGLTVRYGAKAIEFEKGKTAIVVPSKDQLVATLDTVIAGVKAGELDEHLTQYAKARGVPKAQRAA